MIYDEEGLYEKYSFSNLVINKIFKEEEFESLLKEMANEREDSSVGFRGGMFSKDSQFAVFTDDEEDLSYVNDKEEVQFQFWVKGKPKAEEKAVAEEEAEEDQAQESAEE